jgi:hypothetical protein
LLYGEDVALPASHINEEASLKKIACGAHESFLGEKIA